MPSTSQLRGYIDIIGYLVVFIMATNASTGVRANATCGRELGMKNGDIRNEQISASTTFTSTLGPWKPSYARIGNQYAWYPSSYDTNQWLQVDLRQQIAISGVQTQGHHHSGDSYYVKSFKLNYRVDTGFRWQEAFQGKIFEGSRAADQIKVNTFTTPIVASAIRFLPQTWHTGIALRVELLGCDLSDITCGEPPSISHAVVITNHSGYSYGEWRTYECAAGFTSPLSKYDLLCSINGSWYWTNGAPDCTKIPTTRSPTISPVTTVSAVTSSTESTGNSSAVSSSTIPIAAGAAGGLLLLIFIIVTAIVCR
ncbi:lactadherin-like isoform X1 [Branchiostoma floridae]|uniref:Lactadherin-like isoform X1 n=1 Tax=Branchiostoma floridae TaxID=7739 RepID=A0A9J7MVV7_BRAFL|nr:lactadherin-like isoform X1 [Branchiostoma floridae]